MPIQTPILVRDFYTISINGKEIVVSYLPSSDENCTCLTCDTCHSSYYKSYLSRAMFARTTNRIYSSPKICDECVNRIEREKEREARNARIRERARESDGYLTADYAALEERMMQVGRATQETDSSMRGVVGSWTGVDLANTQPVNIESYHPVFEMPFRNSPVQSVAMDIETSPFRTLSDVYSYRPRLQIVHDDVQPEEPIEDEMLDEPLCEICGDLATCSVNGRMMCDECAEL